MRNVDDKIVRDFGDEWEDYDYSSFNKKKLKDTFDKYFSIFPWNLINKKSIGFDMGCGTGRWAQFIADRVAHLYCVDPSEAINIAKKNLKNFNNISYLKETTEECTLKENSMDFGYSLGVLHHIPDTQKAIKDCNKFLKKDSPFLIYLYYDFENKPIWFKNIWKISNFFRKIISKCPAKVKKFICNLIAYLVYFPFSRLSLILEKFGFDVSNFPLSEYRTLSLYQCRNDSLDRFGTCLEQRFSKLRIIEMLSNAGFKDINFSSSPPFWCCISKKK